MNLLQQNEDAVVVSMAHTPPIEHDYEATANQNDV
eukprot:CAMPEP_0183717002 /NCGR_PEP_ID=MMETSP0737-20130205/10722_1 /TAXON_ID=385413 /ORGANISM="Thalassiosira miniscula, Strain CCMP1093" /LENGTH=34 /DNA_ID= /DNA_START= /DNA_END= /DNA_ORIENTATION=